MTRAFQSSSIPESQTTTHCMKSFQEIPMQLKTDILNSCLNFDLLFFCFTFIQGSLVERISKKELKYFP